jgi:hypothetical protein
VSDGWERSGSRGRRLATDEHGKTRNKQKQRHGNSRRVIRSVSDGLQGKEKKYMDGS